MRIAHVPRKLAVCSPNPTLLWLISAHQPATLTCNTVERFTADAGSLSGLSLADVSWLNQMISNVAVQHVSSPLTVQTANTQASGRHLQGFMRPGFLHCLGFVFPDGLHTVTAERRWLLAGKLR